MARFLLAVVLAAAVLGALGARPSPGSGVMPLWATVLVALAGALVGGLAALVAGAGDILLLAAEILGAVAAVLVVQRLRAGS